MQKVTIIGIAGPSGSGKSYLASQLKSGWESAEFPGEISIVHEDGYYRDQSDMDFQQREKTNYDHPDAFEHELLVKQLVEFRAGNSICVPQYNYAEHNRMPETVQVVANQILVVEGILLFHDATVRNQLDIKIFVDTSIESCLKRRIQRDTQQRGRSEESVRKQYQTTVMPMYRQFVEPSRQYADLMVQGVGGNEVLLEMLLSYLRDAQTIAQ